MKIILLQNFKTLGKTGDIKDVAEGYARNFLLPKKMAELATETALKELEIKKSQEKELEKARTEALKSSVEKFKNKKITIKSKEKDGKLFGSISAKDIAEELKKENLAVPEKSIIMDEVIKKTGEYEIKIELNPEIKIIARLKVVGEK